MAGENTDPARAFDDLRAEVSVLRRAVEGLPEAWRENRPPDYSPDLGRMVNALGAVGRHLEAIEKNPMLKIEPTSYRHAVEQAGMAASQRMQGVVDSAIREVQVERRKLAGIVGAARDRYRQRWWVLGAAGLAFLCGLAVAPSIFREMGWGGISMRVASYIVGGSSLWESGGSMMMQDDSGSWDDLVTGSKIVHDNKVSIGECIEISNKTKEEKNCMVKIRVGLKEG